MLKIRSAVILVLLLVFICGCQWRESKAKKSSQAAGQVRPVSRVATTRPDGSIVPAILIVGREYITADEVIRRIRPQLQASASTYNEDSFKRRAEELLAVSIRDMISENLLYQEIAARITEEQNPAVQKAVDKEVNNLAVFEAGGSKVVLEKMLAEQGSDMEELKKQIVTQQYLREKMKPQVIITRDDLWDYYKSHENEFLQPAKVHLMLIEIDAENFLPKDATWALANNEQRQKARMAASDRMKSAQGKLSCGEDFAKLAKEFSTAVSGRTGGDMGWISRGSYRLKKLEDEAFKLKAGEISKPVEIENKIFLLKVAETQPERKVSFTDAQIQIRQALEQDCYRKLVTRHLEKLWEKSQIGSIDEFVDVVYQRLPKYESLRKKIER